MRKAENNLLLCFATAVKVAESKIIRDIYPKIPKKLAKRK